MAQSSDGPGGEGGNNRPPSPGEGAPPEVATAMTAQNGGSIMTELKAEFRLMCSELRVSDDTMKKAQNMWEELWLFHQTEFIGKHREWFGCVVYKALVDNRMSYGLPDPQLQCGHPDTPNFSVTDLLKKVNMNILIFFERMNRLRNLQDFSETVNHHLIHLEKVYCVTSAIFHMFERIFAKVFKQSSCLENGVSEYTKQALNADGAESQKKLCWTLYLLCKASSVNGSQELVLSFHILICCVEYVAQSTPLFLLNSPFDTVKTKGTEVENQPSLLEKLVDEFKLSYNEVHIVQQELMNKFLETLPQMNGNLDVAELENIYQNLYQEGGKLNELDFLRHDPLLYLSSSSEQVALNTVQQLCNSLRSAPDHPNENLKMFFQNCTVSPHKPILERIQNLTPVFISKYFNVNGSMSQELVHQRFQLAVKLYFRIMESLLQQEQKRLSMSDFTNLLHHDTFQRALLACSTEIILMIYSVVWNPSTRTFDAEESRFSFPWILEVFNLKAYDFLRVLESVLRAEPQLPSQVAKHIQSVETKILEYLVWQEDSPVFETFNFHQQDDSQTSVNADVPCPNVGSEPPSLPALMPHTNESPKGSRLLSTPTRSAPFSCSPGHASNNYLSESPGLSSYQNTPRNTRSLHFFFNKVCRLAYQRLQCLCAMLHVSEELQKKVWTCFEYCITQRQELLRNRYLDQIMMCSLYGICKVVKKEIKFKTVVTEYKKTPHALPQVFKMTVEDGEYDSIIGFYNKVFLHCMKSYLLEFSVSKPVTPTLSPAPKASPMSSSPVYSVVGRKKFFLSSLKERDPGFKSPTQLTPGTSQLYCFGERTAESAEKLKSINESVARTGHMKSRSQKRLKFDSPEESATRSTEPSCLPSLWKESPFKSPCSPITSPVSNHSNSTRESVGKGENPLSASPRRKKATSPKTRNTQRLLKFDASIQNSCENTDEFTSTCCSPVDNSKKENHIER